MSAARKPASREEVVQRLCYGVDRARQLAAMPGRGSIQGTREEWLDEAECLDAAVRLLRGELL